MAKIVHDYACQFPLIENGDAQLLQGCYAIWMERLAQSIAVRVIEIPKDH
ncbi:arylsulfatase [Salmonella enterica]